MLFPALFSRKMPSTPSLNASPESDLPPAGVDAFAAGCGVMAGGATGGGGAGAGLGLFRFVINSCNASSMASTDGRGTPLPFSEKNSFSPKRMQKTQAFSNVRFGISSYGRVPGLGLQLLVIELAK